MNRVDAWRQRLIVAAVVGVLLGVACCVFLVLHSVSPYPGCNPDCLRGEPWDWLPGAAVFLGPLLVVLAGVALVVRWMLRRIASLPRGKRAGTVTLLAVATTLIGAVAYGVVFGIVLVTVLVTACSTHGC